MLEMKTKAVTYYQFFLIESITNMFCRIFSIDFYSVMGGDYEDPKPQIMVAIFIIINSSNMHNSRYP